MKTINLLPKAPKRWAALLFYQRKLSIAATAVLIVFINIIIILVLFERFVVYASESKTQELITELTSTLESRKDKQALLLTIDRKLITVRPLIQNRFPYATVLTELQGVIPPSVRLLEFALDSTGSLSFSLRAHNAKDIDTLISAILSFNFSPSFQYTLQASTRDQQGSYLLKFLFTRKK